MIDFTFEAKNQLSTENELVKQWQVYRELLAREDSDEFPIVHNVADFLNINKNDEQLNDNLNQNNGDKNRVEAINARIGNDQRVLNAHLPELRAFDAQDE